MKKLLKFILHPATLSISIILSELAYITGFKILKIGFILLSVILPIAVFFWLLDYLVSLYTNWYKKTFDK